VSIFFRCVQIPMKFQTSLFMMALALTMLITLWASFFRASPDLPSAFEWETSLQKSIEKVVPTIRSKHKPFPKPDGAGVRSKSPRGALKSKIPEAPPMPRDPKARPTLQVAEEATRSRKAVVVHTKAVEAAIGDANLPLHITGRWTDSLHQLQAYLMPQLAGPPDERALWLTRLGQRGAPGPKPSDVVIRHQLMARTCCNDLLQKVPWTRADLVQDLKFFMMNVYPNRPIYLNSFGMRLSHAFGCWFIARKLQPEYILESGVHRGQSTWLLRQAVPSAKIISMDPKTDMTHWDKEATYYTGNGEAKTGFDVRPFKDFSEIDWSFIKDKAKALILWDDHQNEFKRILLAHKLGFRHMIFDDNWSPLQGDNYSIKQVCDETGGLALRPATFPSQKVLMCDKFHMADQFISQEEHRANRQSLLHILDVYYESPPVLFVPTHMQYTPFGHTPKADKSGVEYVMPRPSVRLLRWMCDALIPPPIVQSQAEFDEAGLSNVTHPDLWFYMSLAYARLTP